MAYIGAAPRNNFASLTSQQITGDDGSVFCDFLLYWTKGFAFFYSGIKIQIPCRAMSGRISTGDELL